MIKQTHLSKGTFFVRNRALSIQLPASGSAERPQPLPAEAGVTLLQLKRFDALTQRLAYSGSSWLPQSTTLAQLRALAAVAQSQYCHGAGEDEGPSAAAETKSIRLLEELNALKGLSVSCGKVTDSVLSVRVCCCLRARESECTGWRRWPNSQGHGPALR